MGTDLPPLSADELLEQFRAETRLANMDLFEDLAILYETETTASLRKKFAQRYLRLIGVVPEQRQEFRAALKRIVAGGRQPIADVVELFAHQRQANGSTDLGAD